MIIDISSFQKTIDWPTVKTTPQLEGVYIKACEGVNAPDKGFDLKAAKCQALNIPFGFYHFNTLNNSDVVTDATSEAQYFAKLVKPFKTTLPHVLDCERNVINLSKDKVLLWIQTFFKELERQGITNYVLYSGTPFLNSNLPANHNLGNIKLWVSAYTPAPKMPIGWTKFWLWQYTQTGTINGIQGGVDLSKRI